MKSLEVMLNPREIRQRLGLNQEQFWTQIGVTQSGGSRYESGRTMPRPVRELLRLVHIEGIRLDQLEMVVVKLREMGMRVEDLHLAIHAHPTLSEALMEAAAATAGEATRMKRAKRDTDRSAMQASWMPNQSQIVISCSHREGAAARRIQEAARIEFAATATVLGPTAAARNPAAVAAARERASQLYESFTFTR